MKYFFVLFLALTLAVWGEPAHAEWVKFGHFGDAVRYVDLDRVKRTKDGVRYWVRNEFDAADNKGALSSVWLLEYECGTDRYRFLDFKSYQSSDLSGRVVYANSSPSDWQYAAPQSFAELTGVGSCELVNRKKSHTP
jgi:hypothetical protein